MQRDNALCRLRAAVCLGACALFLAACAGGGSGGGSGGMLEELPPAGPYAENFAGDVQDLAVIPQDLRVFASGTAPGAMRGEAAGRKDAEHYLRRMLSPWQEDVDPEPVFREMNKILSWKKGRRGFAENLRPWTDEDWRALAVNAGLGAARGACRPAITVHAADLRLAPTMRPRFARLTGAGQGYPFDDFQQTALHAGTPLAVIHASEDGAWLLAVSPVASGWIQAEHVAFAGEAFRDRWSRGPFLAFLEDDIPLAAHGAYWGSVSIGTLLPRAGDGAVLVPVRGQDGTASAAAARLPQDSQACPFPMEMTAENIAAVGNRMMGQKYGWGGMYGDRDCSATMRDLFTPFGLWLPRNSGAQAKAGSYVPLTASTAAAREREIISHAAPFRTLLCIRGHVGLFVGTHGGVPVFLHDCWGVRTQLPDGRPGRLIIGRTVITSTRPGKERPDIPEAVQLIHKIHGVSVLGGHWEQAEELTEHE